MDVSTLLTLVLSLLALLITYTVFKINNCPRIIVYMTPHYGKNTLIQLNIKNIGLGIAENITINSDQAIPRSAFGITQLTEPKKIFDKGIFKYGIKFFHPKQSYVFDWGQYGGLKDALNDQPITFYITYYYKHPLNLWKSKITDISTIDIRELQALPASLGNIEDKLENIYKELKTMNKSLNK